MTGRTLLVLFMILLSALAGSPLSAESKKLEGSVWRGGKEVAEDLVFTGENSVMIPDSPVLRIESNFSIEAWVKPYTLDGGYVILKKNSFGFPAFSGDGKVNWYMYMQAEKGTPQRGRSIPDICQVNEWQHYVLTYDTAYVRAYYNGKQVHAYPMTLRVAKSDSPVLIGNAGGWGKNFQGEVGLARIYGSVLSAEEIELRYKSLSRGKEPLKFESVVLEVPEAKAEKGSGYRLLTNEELRVEAGDWEPGKKKAYLSFTGRIETSGWKKSGSAFACIISVNGVPTSLERLLNKAPYYFHSREARLWWFNPNSSTWRFSYHPWEDMSRGDHVNRFVLDITDLMKGKNNQIVFRNIFSYGENNKPLEIKDLQIFTDDGFDKCEDLQREDPPYRSLGMERFRTKARALHGGVATRLNTDIAFRQDIGTVEPSESYKQEFSFKMLPSGGMGLSLENRKFNMFSSLRFSGEQWRDIGHGNNQGKWKQFSITSEGIDAETERMAWQRRLVRKDSHLEIRDTFTNRTTADQPVMLVNMLDMGGVEDMREFRIAGQMQNTFFICSDPMYGRMNSTTPVAYVGMKDCGIGMVVEDDAYRNHNTWMTWDATLAAGTDQFYLSPGTSYTFVWKIYPLARPDYYGLVNAIRHDWNLYQNIPGLFGFIHAGNDQRMYESTRYKTAEERAGFIRSSGIGVASAVLRYPGTENRTTGFLYGGERLGAHRKAAEAHREADNGFLKWKEQIQEQEGMPVKFLPYMGVHLARLTDGETLEGLMQRYPGGLPLDIWGEPVAYRQGWLYCTLPRADNAVGRHLMDILRLYMDELKFDGIYLDEWDFSRARVSFGHSDGVSALLDKEGHIIRKFGHVPLMVKEFQIKFVEELVKRNATIFANQFASTLELAQLPVVHFAEPVSYNSYLLSAAQISRTPLGLHLKPRVNLFDTVREYLKRGILTCYYWYYLHGDHVLKRCYPITVREIRPGVVIGEDRIITCASGNFTLRRNKPLRAYVYDAPDGLLKEILSQTRSQSGYTVIDVQLTETQVAVIVEE